MRDTAGSEASALKRGPDRSGWVGIMVLVVLIGLTAWVVSWVSIWWVPCYLVLMGLIFINPSDWRTPRKVAGPGEDISGSADLRADVSGWSAKRDRLEGPIDHRSSDDSDAVMLLDGPPETLGLELDSDGSALDVARPKRGRGRGRKSAKTADGPTSGAAPATWIRVGPGKFVRADASDLSLNADQAESQDFATGDVRLADEPGAMATPMDELGTNGYSVTDDGVNLDGPVEAISVSGVPIITDRLTDAAQAFESTAILEERSLVDEPEMVSSMPIETAKEVVSELEPEIFAEPSAVAHVTTTEDAGLPEFDLEEMSTPAVASPAWADSALTPVAEEYGIAPSAFGTDGEEASCDEEFDSLESGELADADGDSDLAEDFDPDVYSSDVAEEFAEASSEQFLADSGDEFIRGRLSVWPAGVSRWTVNAVAAVSGASSRRNIRGGARPVNRKGRRPYSNRRLQRAARGGLGHGEHVRHTWRPRSPPWGG